MGDLKANFLYTKYMDSFENYMFEHLNLVKDSDVEQNILKLINEILAGVNTDTIIYTVGNGGSYTTAEHFAADLNLTFQLCGQRIRSFCIGSQLSTQTALSNDISYEKALALQLDNSFRENDILITFSASGNSANIIEALLCAQKFELEAFSFTGFNGGKILKLDKINKIHINSRIGAYGEIENIHLMICHYIIEVICKKFS